MKRRRRRDWQERFWEKVDRSDGMNACWLWTGALDAASYAGFWLDGRTVLAHRVSYELAHGKMPAGLTVDHTCHTYECAGGKTDTHRHCVNPTHLEAVPMRVNILRGRAPTAIAARKTHCKRGHPLSGDNLYGSVEGHRRCHACHLTWKRAYHAQTHTVIAYGNSAPVTTTGSTNVRLTP